MEILSRISEHLQQGHDDEVAQLTRSAVEQKLPPGEILNAGLIAGMDVVGRKFGAREIFLPDVLLAARAMHAGMEVLKPLLLRENVPTLGKVVIGTVQGDLHDIGKNLVSIMLRGAGFEVIDLGNDVAPERFVEAARESGAGIIGMSALLTTTMPVMGRVVGLLQEQGLAGRIRTIIGGAPLSEAFAREISADAYGFDAANAVERTRALMRA